MGRRGSWEVGNVDELAVDAQQMAEKGHQTG
jgi:hypothetical protein